jgi:hypothetical protein
MYRKQGYDVVHFSAPDKKYSAPGYTGPSYLEDIVSLLVSLSGKKIVYDRSWMGESAVWPFVYGRNALLTSEDIEYIREIEDQNQPTRILLHDPDTRAHWQRCVDNKEPLDPIQFKTASSLFYTMAEQYGFALKTKHDFNDTGSQPDQSNTTEQLMGPNLHTGVITEMSTSKPKDLEHIAEAGRAVNLTPEQKRLAELMLLTMFYLNQL